MLYAGSNDWHVAEAMQQHPFVCVQWAGKEMNHRRTRSYNRSRQAQPVTSREKKISPVDYNSQEASHPPPHSAYTGFSGGPGLTLPLLCWRPCFRSLWSPPDGGAPTPIIQQVCVAAVVDPESTNNGNDIFLATLNKHP